MNMHTNVFSEGWKALREYENSFRIDELGYLSSNLLEERYSDVGVDYPGNYSFSPERRGAWGQKPNKVHLIHQVLSIPKAGKVKWMLTSFHSIMYLQEGEYEPKNRYFKQVKFVSNPVEDGHRFQIMETNGCKTKIHWGYDQNVLDRQFTHSHLRVLAQQVSDEYLQPQEIHHLLRWFMDTPNHGPSHSINLRLGGPGWSRLLKGKTGAKDILNGVYDPKGIKRIPKNAFNGVGEIRSLQRLAKAVSVTRALRSLDPHSFAEMSCKSDSVPEYMGSFMYADSVHWFVSKFSSLVTKSDDHRWWNMVEDMVRMLKSMSRPMLSACLNEIRRNQNRGLEWAHDFVVAEYNKIATENLPINVPQLTKFEGTVNNDILCVVPKYTHDLVQWGAEYNICIGSYADRVYNGRTYCMGFQNPYTGIFYGFAEVNPWDRSLVQLLGKHNQPLPDLERLTIEDYLSKVGVSVNNYWGDQRLPGYL
jgi:hypothetical protein